MIFSNSRYRGSVYSIDKNSGSLYYHVRKKKKFNLSLDNSIIHLVVAGETLPLISYRYYGKASLYWVIIDSNPSIQHEFDIKPGDTLVVPSYEQVVKYIGRP